MTHKPHDQFAKDYLEALLGPLGDVEPSLEVKGEPRWIDISFIPRKTDRRKIRQYGVLLKMVARGCLFEPYRTPLLDMDLVNCMAKLSWAQLEQQRKRKERTPLPRDHRIRMWLLTPSATDDRIEVFGFRPDPDNEWPKGFYQPGPAWGLGLIVLDRLPETPETLWLRIMGRGQTQKRAIETVKKLPKRHGLRENVVKLLYKWRIILREKPPETQEEKELETNLARTFEEWEQQTLAAERKGERRGMRKGERKATREVCLDLWRKRFGEPAPSVVKRISSFSSAVKLKALALELAVAADVEEATAAMESSPTKAG